MLREFTCIMCPQGCDISVELDAPVHEGDVAIHDVLGLGVDVIVTKDVEVA